MTAVSFILFFYRTYVFLKMILQTNKKHNAVINSGDIDYTHFWKEIKLELDVSYIPTYIFIIINL